MILDNIIKDGLKTLESLPNVNYRIDNIILGKSIYTMKDCQTIFSDMNMCLLLLEQGYGFTYFQKEIDFKAAENYVNKDLREILQMDIPLHIKVAIADSIYSVINNLELKYKYNYLKGDLRTKAKLRAIELIKGIPKKSKVVLLGAATEIIDECAEREIDVSVLDLEPSKIGLTFSKKAIENSSLVFEDKMKNADYVIATGMIFVSETADTLFENARKNKYKLILYMETGSNYGNTLLQYGAHKVLSEFFPYYDFNGDTRYIIHEK